MASLVLDSTSRPSSSRSATFTSTSTQITAPSVATPASAPEEDPRIQFTTVDELFNQIDRAPGDVLIVTHVSLQQFAAIERERDTRRRGFRFRRYYANSQILIITIPTHLHEQLHLILERKYISQLIRMGLDESWKSIGTATYRTRGHPGGDGGEGDSTGGPRPACTGPDNWPTLVIKAGASQSLRELRNDKDWWFSASNHAVKIIILAKFARSQDEIRLEKWEEILQAVAVRPGATITQAAAARATAGNRLAPILRESITITRNTATNPPSYNVTRGALVLSFRLLFLRDPGPGEGDFVVSIPDLQFYAEQVWAEVID